MPLAFGLFSSAHGAMIVNRFDYHTSFDGKWYGVGAQILENGAYDPADVSILKDLLRERRVHHGDGAMVIDCGANIGVFTVEIAKFMSDWGKIIAVEAQERLFYALAGNLALQNCFNARAIWAAIDRDDGFIDIPEPKYDKPSSFGSFELRERFGIENIGQEINYSKPTMRVQTFKLDSIGLKRVDLIKLDIEGMEMDALAGATKLIERCKPLIWIECIKLDGEELEKFLQARGYRTFAHGMNALGVHESDPVIKSIVVEERKAA